MLDVRSTGRRRGRALREAIGEEFVTPAQHAQVENRVAAEERQHRTRPFEGQRDQRRFERRRAVAGHACAPPGSAVTSDDHRHGCRHARHRLLQCLAVHLLGRLGADDRATSPSGKARVCKTLTGSSILPVASICVRRDGPAWMVTGPQRPANALRGGPRSFN